MPTAFFPTAEVTAVPNTPIAEIPATAVPTTPALTETPLPPSPTVAVTAVPDNTPTPINQDPVIITSDFTNVRRGSGLAYEISHVLKAGTTNAILGRDNTGSWWAVPGAGDNPRPVGWISGAVVTVQGDLSRVPVLDAPPLIPDVPIMGNTNSLPADVCIVAHPGLCQPDDRPGSIPLIEEPGPPPTDLCLTHRPGQFPPPDVHLEPG